MGLAAHVRNRAFLNISSLYVSIAINAAVNLAWIAYLARVLGSEVWGLLLLTQAFGIWVSIIPDYGFNLSGGRAIAQATGDQEISRIAYSVTASKAILSFAVVPAALIAYFAIEGFRGNPLFLIGGVIYAIAQGFDPMWLFQGVERQYLYSIVNSFARVFALALTVLFVNGPADGWLAMYIQAGGALLIFAVGTVYLVRTYPPVRIAFSDVRDMLKRGWEVFQFRAAQSIYGSGLLILGAVAPSQVEAFGNAERIVRNVVSLFSPIMVVGMPRIARLLGSDADAARQTARWSFIIMVGLGLAAGALLILLAPLVVQILLGPGYEFVAPILQISALSLPLATASMMLGMQWMVALGLDRALVRITVTAGLFNIVGFAVIGSTYGAYGAAIMVVTVDAIVVTATTLAIRRAGHLNFWRSQVRSEADVG